MAFPILFNMRHVEAKDLELEAKDNVVFMALSNFGINDSGLLFECEYDDSHEFPWGVRIVQVKGGDFSYFYELSDEKKGVFSSELSNLLNGYYGADAMGKPVSIKANEVAEKLGEQVYTFASSAEDKVTLIPVGLTQKELFDKAPKEQHFFSDFPAGYMSPKASGAASND